MRRSAHISACGRFRYSLDREWDSLLPAACFIMLNPSTADADLDDPTIRKCIGFAKRMGLGSIKVVNLFAWRATDPKNLKSAGFPVGEENDWAIWLNAKESADVVICAWGAHARGLARTQEVMGMLKGWNIRPKALSLLADGTPAHPLMLPYTDTWIDLASGDRDRAQPITENPRARP